MGIMKNIFSSLKDKFKKNSNKTIQGQEESKEKKEKKKQIRKLQYQGFLDRLNFNRDKSKDIKNATSSRVKTQSNPTEEVIPDNKKDEPLMSFRNVDSTAIQDMKYNPNTQNMSIKFRGGKKFYVYPGVPEEVAENFRTAKSKGKYFNSDVKPYSINQ